MPTRRQCANAIRALAIDAIEKSRSGHPGAPLGMADMAEALWRHGFKHNPANPGWPDRDRFVLSNGHASMLQYAVLHLTGYDFPIEEIKNFRQWGSQTPGHPERGLPPGVEMTTGPLGQGISSAVGMALAERMLAARFNTPEQTVVDHRTYAFCGDALMVDAVAAEDCTVLLLSTRVLSDARVSPAVRDTLLRNLLAVSMRKSLSLSQRIFCTTPKTVRGRLLTYFSAQAAKAGGLEFDVPFNRQQMADYLNLDRSALSKELCKMRDEGLLEFEKNHFRLNELPE